MTDRPTPGPAGFGTDLRAVKAYVSVDRWRDVMTRAALAGMSVSAYLNALIERDQLDGDGRPVWAPVRPDEELPIAS
jgi:hypothetical protein